jgi:hypothetical protein
MGKHQYKNRSAELRKLIEVLRNAGVYGIEELSKLLVQTIKSYAGQLHLEPLNPYEIEYIWVKLMD